MLYVELGWGVVFRLMLMPFLAGRSVMLHQRSRFVRIESFRVFPSGILFCIPRPCTKHWRLRGLFACTPHWYCFSFWFNPTCKCYTPVQGNSKSIVDLFVQSNIPGENHCEAADGMLGHNAAQVNFGSIKAKKVVTSTRVLVFSLKRTR